MWKLVIEDDEGKRTVVPLTRDQYSIGRKEGNTIRLTERNVSREHARLLKRTNGREEPRGGAASPTERSKNGSGVKDAAQPDGGERSTFVLEDLTSYNGVFVNGLRISHAQLLSHGDLVQIGDYRIILQDESLADVIEVSSDSKQTLRDSHNVRAATLLDRPNRLVMLAGPSPGAEFPLDRDRMTVGRAEDASISINHNSVSRLHCEVHALGDGRFEIVDKGSSNGVRVNGSELRRGIVEQGDVIELGDVRFKFVGAGQIFRQTDSGQLALLGDREANHVARARRGNGLPLTIFAAVVVVGAAAAWIWARPHPAEAPAPAARPSTEEATLADAKRLCAAGDCEAAHDNLSALPEGSTLRASQDFRDLENEWADGVLARAESETDWAKKRTLYQRVAQAVSVSGTRRKTAADKLEQSELIANGPGSAAPSPSASAKSDPEDAIPAHLATAHRATVPVDGKVADTPSAALPVPQATANGAGANGKATAPTVDDRERQLALQGTPDAKLQLKQQLEQRVEVGRASDTEIRLLISTCKDLGDRACVQQARAALKQRP